MVALHGEVAIFDVKTIGEKKNKTKQNERGKKGNIM